MRALTESEIERLAQRKGVRRLAVENFLGTLGSMNRSEAMGNLAIDQSSYGWNIKTYTAIKDGINLAGAEGKEDV